MLNLVGHATTPDKIKLTTSSTAPIDVHVSHMDCSDASPPVVDAPSKTNTAITTAATTDICVAPTNAAKRRNVKTINVRNKHASTANDVTIVYDAIDGTDYELAKVTLLAGQTLSYVEGVGWYVLQSQGKLDQTMVVTADVTNATTSFADVTGLTCPVEAGKHYNFECKLFHIENASTTGARFGINGPTMTAMRIFGISVFAGSITAATFNAALADVTAVDTSAVGVTTSSAGTPQVVMAIMSGWINPSAAGTFAIRSQSEVAVASAVIVKAGSWCRLWETPQG